LAQFALRGVAVEADKATEATMARLKHLVRYLLGCGGHVQVTKPDASKPLIQAWSDSDWAGDRATRKSVDCVVIKVYGAIVHVSSKGQMAIAQSSAEAELGGAHRAGLYAIGIQNTWHEMYEDCLPIELLMDSSAGKIMAVRRGKGRVRHLEVRQLYLQRLTNSGRVKALKCRGDTNVADVGTKPIEKKRIGQFMEWLGVENSKDEAVVNQLGLGIPHGLRKALAALVCATLVAPSDAFNGEACRSDMEISVLLLLLFATWLCGLAIGARMNFVAAPASASTGASGTASDMPAGKSKAKSKATSRASSSTGGGDTGKGGCAQGGPGDHAPPSPDQLALAVPTALQPELLVTQFGQRYHRRLTCTGLRNARVVLGPYTACLICADGP
jgi:hypothetical protein